MATKGIWISIEIMHDENLTANEKFILSEIEQLSSLEHGCYASNQHFADLIGIARENASRVISKLVSKGYITTETKKGSRNHERSIKMITPSVKTSRPPYQNVIEVVSKRQETKENKQLNKHINKQGLNLDAFSMWLSHKGKTYSKQGGVLSANKLRKHSFEVQMQMVESSIMNNYKGLFEPKQQSSYKQKEAPMGSLEWERQQMIKSQGVLDAELI